MTPSKASFNDLSTSWPGTFATTTTTATAAWTRSTTEQPRGVLQLLHPNPTGTPVLDRATSQIARRRDFRSPGGRSVWERAEHGKRPGCGQTRSVVGFGSGRADGGPRCWLRRRRQLNRARARRRVGWSTSWPLALPWSNTVAIHFGQKCVGPPWSGRYSAAGGRLDRATVRRAPDWCLAHVPGRQAPVRPRASGRLLRRGRVGQGSTFDEPGDAQRRTRMARMVFHRLGSPSFSPMSKSRSSESATSSGHRPAGSRFCRISSMASSIRPSGAMPARRRKSVPATRRTGSRSEKRNERTPRR